MTLLGCAGRCLLGHANTRLMSERGVLPCVPEPQDPTCARLAIFGRMLPIEAADKDMAQELLFAQHPAMKTWPADHGFGM